MFLVFSFPICTYGSDFYWEVVEYDSGGTYNRLVLSGEIRTGDADKFRSFMRQNFEKYKDTARIRLASNGGNLYEALKMTVVIRSLYASIYVEGDKCASSCFFLYLSGVRRYADESLLGIHRAYFDPAYFKGLNAEEAKSGLIWLTKQVDLILDENQVPQYLKERMNRTPSAAAYWLINDDLRAIGEMPPWYEELLIARCDYGLIASTYNRWENGVEDDNFDAEALANKIIKSGKCEDELIRTQLSHLPSTLIQEKVVKRSAKP